MDRGGLKPGPVARPMIVTQGKSICLVGEGRRQKGTAAATALLWKQSKKKMQPIAKKIKRERGPAVLWGLTEKRFQLETKKG